MLEGLQKKTNKLQRRHLHGQKLLPGRVLTYTEMKRRMGSSYTLRWKRKGTTKIITKGEADT